MASRRGSSSRSCSARHRLPWRSDARTGPDPRAARPRHGDRPPGTPSRTARGRRGALVAPQGDGGGRRPPRRAPAGVGLDLERVDPHRARDRLDERQAPRGGEAHVRRLDRQREGARGAAARDREPEGASLARRGRAAGADGPQGGRRGPRRRRRRRRPRPPGRASRRSAAMRSASSIRSRPTSPPGDPNAGRSSRRSTRSCSSSTTIFASRSTASAPPRSWTGSARPATRSSPPSSSIG